MEMPIKGIIPPIVTPLINCNKLDISGLEKLINHLISGGVHGLFILGTTGEATSLTYDLRKELITRTCEFVGGRIPVMAGITDTSFTGSLEIAEFAAKSGIDGLVIAPPYYIPISQEEMREYLENIVPKLPLPFMMYNMPSCTKLHMDLDTIKKARELGAIGIKDSSGDIGYLYSLLQEFKSYPDFSIITGTELHIPETILNGGHGAVPGGANLYPRLFVEWYNALINKEMEKANQITLNIKEINNTIYRVGKHKSRIIKGIKCALSVMEICSDYTALPLRKFKDEERSQIEKHISDLSRSINGTRY